MKNIFLTLLATLSFASASDNSSFIGDEEETTNSPRKGLPCPDFSQSNNAYEPTWQPGPPIKNSCVALIEHWIVIACDNPTKYKLTFTEKFATVWTFK